MNLTRYCASGANEHQAAMEMLSPLAETSVYLGSLVLVVLIVALAVVIWLFLKEAMLAVIHYRELREEVEELRKEVEQDDE